MRTDDFVFYRDIFSDNSCMMIFIVSLAQCLACFQFKHSVPEPPIGADKLVTDKFPSSQRRRLRWRAMAQHMVTDPALSPAGRSYLTNAVCHSEEC